MSYKKNLPKLLKYNIKQMYYNIYIITYYNMNAIDCPICLEIINNDDSITILCNHKFHLSCLHLLHEKNLEKIELECPLCRSSFYFFNELLRKKICGKTLFLLQKFINYDGSLNKIYDYKNEFDYMIMSPKYYYTILLWREILLKNNSFKIKKLLNYGALINSRNNLDDNLLIWALKNRCSLHIIKILVYYGIDLYASNNFGENGLGYSILNDSCLRIIDFLASVYDINEVDEDGNNALMACVKLSKSIYIIKILLRYDANINKTDIFGNSILMVAIVNKYSLEDIDYLLKKGSNINYTNKIGYNVITLGVINNIDKQFVKFLVKKGCNLNNFLIPLIIPTDTFAAMTNFIFILKYYKDDLEMVTFLLDNGADINLCMKNGNTPLIMALVYKCSFEIVNLFIKNGAFINIQNIIGSSPLIVAIKNDAEKEIIKLLLINGADKNLKNNDNESAFMIAQNKNYDHDILKLLEC